MISRYSTRRTVINREEQYSDTFRNRNVPFIEQHTTSKYKNINASDIESIGYRTHVYTTSDRPYLLAYKYYGDPTLWWIIFRVNNISNQNQLFAGKLLIIPTNLSGILAYLGD